jgi:hypothetical protein
LWNFIELGLPSKTQKFKSGQTKSGGKVWNFSQRSQESEAQQEQEA